MEPEVSLPCSQQPAAGPYPEPDESSPHLPIHGLLFWLVSFREVSRPNFFMHFLSLPCVLRTSWIPSSLTFYNHKLVLGIRFYVMDSWTYRSVMNSSEFRTHIRARGRRDEDARGKETAFLWGGGGFTAKPLTSRTTQSVKKLVEWGVVLRSLRGFK
jgi:hypothetical protein